MFCKIFIPCVFKSLLLAAAVSCSTVKQTKTLVLYYSQTGAPPVLSLLNSVNVGEKTIVPFCTFSSGGLESSYNDIKKSWPEAKLKEGFGIRNARIEKAAKELQRFLISGGFIEGEIQALPEFPEQQEVGEEQVAIFNAACSSYPMPLGSPVSYAARTTPEGTEYLFGAVNPGMDGNSSTSMIYVFESSEEGSSPEFIRAVR